jgi:transcriptional regulator GlxA family with amidase domain
MRGVHMADRLTHTPLETNSGETDSRIKMAITLLEEAAFASTISLEEIAVRLCVSSSHLRHLFKRSIGTTPTHYVKELRLSKAKEMLETTFFSVKEIMAAVGFADLSHFVRDYKERYGKTPSRSRGVQQQPLPGKRARNFGQ